MTHLRLGGVEGIANSRSSARRQPCGSGGGNFGVVTRFSFRFHEVGPFITGGLIAWDMEQADIVVPLYRQLADSTPARADAPKAPFIPEA